jgi:hypothetical protein
VALLAAFATSAAAQPVEQQASGVDNQPTAPFDADLQLLRPEDARVTRYEDRVEFEVTMTTPTPGTYVYPDSVPAERYASPEAFTLWAFVFNHPEACATPNECGPGDFTEAVQGGLYGVAGHLTAVDHSGGAFELDRDGGGRMTLRGEVKVGDPSRTLPSSPTFPLQNPLGAELHVAVAPHGQADPAAIASELYEPAGNPACGCWWLAFFPPPPSG